MFDQDGGRLIYFEGTYTHTFSGNDNATPRYDYNQIMYRLDLADPRLNLPVAVYRLARGGFGPAPRLGRGRHPPPGRFLRARSPGGGKRAGLRDSDRGRPARARGRQTLDPGCGGRSSLPCLPADAVDPPATTVALYAIQRSDRTILGYATGDESEPEAAVARRSEPPICRVWRNPVGVALPRE